MAKLKRNSNKARFYKRLFWFLPVLPIILALFTVGIVYGIVGDSEKTIGNSNTGDSTLTIGDGKGGELMLGMAGMAAVAPVAPLDPTLGSLNPDLYMLPTIFLISLIVLILITVAIVAGSSEAGIGWGQVMIIVAIEFFVALIFYGFAMNVLNIQV